MKGAFHLSSFGALPFAFIAASSASSPSGGGPPVEVRVRGWKKVRHPGGKRWKEAILTCYRSDERPF
jgi:hypothetical protein